MGFNRLAGGRSRGVRRVYGRRGVAPAARAEALEPRLLLSADAPFIVDIEADNRGRVELFVSRDLIASTVSGEDAELFTAGSDGLLGTADDVVRASSVRYDASARSIVILSDLDGAERFGIRLDGGGVLGTNGVALDAEFNGAGVATGDGVAGGELLLFTSQPATQLVRFTTVAGDIDVEMFAEETPLTVANFYDYMNDGVWDTTFFHRLVDSFVIQGGGFDEGRGLPPLEQRDPVLNEPGISNVRGTIAMAKLGNDPNSATNQWFFNLGDNSANLDEQNGGFTVFGRIVGDSSFATLDALAAFETFDASDEGAAFTDLPVRDAAAVENRNGLIVESDLAGIDRIALLVDFEAEPFDQLPAEGRARFEASRGDAAVTVYSLDGVDLGDASDFLRVTFGREGTVSRVQIIGELPSRVGVQISGADVVGSVIDSRRVADGNLSFIVSSGPVTSVQLRGSLAGADLNGVLLSDGVLMPEDIDGDMDFGDETALYVQSGGVRSLRVDGDLTGDVVTEGGVRSVLVRGETRGVDFTGGSFEEPRAKHVFRFGEVRDTDVRTPNQIVSLVATEWTGTRSVIEAPALGVLRTTGSRESAGNFSADVRLTGAGVNERELGLRSAFVAGDLTRSDWSMNGRLASLFVRGDVTTTDLLVNGDVLTYRVLGEVTVSSVVSNGQVRTVMVGGWEGGVIEADSLITLNVFGGRWGSGDFSGEVSLNEDVRGFSVRSVLVRGDLTDATLSLAGDVSVLRVSGDISGSSLTARAVPTVIAGRVSDTELFLNSVRSLRVEEWIGGTIEIPGLNQFYVTGNAREGLAGDLSADVRAANMRLMRVNGDLSGVHEYFDLPTLYVRGDVVDADVTFNQFQPTVRAVNTLRIDGVMRDSEIFGLGRMGSISTSAMFGSGIYLNGPADPFGFPGDGNSYNAGVLADQVMVTGRGVDGVAFEGSYVVGGAIGRVLISEPAELNGGRPFGVAAHTINEVRVTMDGRAVIAMGGPGVSPMALGDFQVRTGFDEPASG